LASRTGLSPASSPYRGTLKTTHACLTVILDSTTTYPSIRFILSLLSYLEIVTSLLTLF
jgi:hypothetical protein